MSAPNTNLEKQASRHIAPLIGIVLAVVFGAGMIFFWLMHESADADPPRSTTMSPDGTGEVAPAVPANAAETGTAGGIGE